MVQRNKIDSNETELSMALEVVGSPGTLPVTPVWIGLEPNEYKDFGGQNTLLARRPINSSRQRKKGNIVDLEANGGFNQDFTNENSETLVSGFMYAAARSKSSAAVTEVTGTGYKVADETIFVVGHILLASGFATAANNGVKVVTALVASPNEVSVAGLVAEALPPAGAKIVVIGYQGAAGVLDVDASGALPTVTSSAANFDAMGLIPGEFIWIGGDGVGTSFTTAANNGPKRIKSVTAGTITIDKSDLAMVTELSATETVQVFFGRVIKNEQADLIVRQTFQLERKMGAPDTDQPAQVQAEYVKGAFPDQLEMRIESADKINVDYSFVAMNSDQMTSIQGVKAGTRTVVEEGDMYNTSTDFSRIKLAVIENGVESPLPLFEFMTDMTLTINNNVSLDKAVAVLGGFDATLGLFEVSVEINAYFTKMESVIAIRQNKDVTIDFVCAKDNRGFAVDVPLVALGDGLADVALDEPIKIPLKNEAATAAKYDPAFNHTLMWTYFDYLPDVASANV